MVHCVYRITHGCRCILPGYCTPTECQRHSRAGLFVQTVWSRQSAILAASETGRQLAASIADWRDQTVCDK